MMKWYTATSIALVTLMSSIYLCSAYCNEAVCASKVSKCMLIKACDCDFSNKTNCECCTNCQLCLEDLYTECCVCVEMCPPTNPDDVLLEASTINDLHDPIPVLFNALTEEVDIYGRWTTFSYPVHYDASVFKPGITGHDIEVGEAVDESHAGDNSHIKQVNCTVAFMASCMSLKKCSDACQSMGAASLRWFHEHGCCECIGSSCHESYGIKKPKCSKCPLPDEELEDQEQGDERLQNEHDSLNRKVGNGEITIEMDEDKQ